MQFVCTRMCITNQQQKNVRKFFMFHSMLLQKKLASQMKKVYEEKNNTHTQKYIYSEFFMLFYI